MGDHLEIQVDGDVGVEDAVKVVEEVVEGDVGVEDVVGAGTVTVTAIILTALPVVMMNVHLMQHLHLHHQLTAMRMHESRKG